MGEEVRCYKLHSGDIFVTNQFNKKPKLGQYLYIDSNGKFTVKKNDIDDLQFIEKRYYSKWNKDYKWWKFWMWFRFYYCIEYKPIFKTK